MSDQPEPLAAVLAEMRAAAESTDLFNGEEVGEPLIRGTKVEEWADRIERAAKNTENTFGMALAIEDGLHKRDKQSAPGNAAAMRDLLEKIRHEYGWGRISCRTCVSSEADVERVSDLFEKQIDAALAAPARNCDICRTKREAKMDYDSRNAEYGSKDDFIDWLFRPAEGGAE